MSRTLPPGYPVIKKLEANGWLPIPRRPLPFPAIAAASRNDPLAQFGKMAGLARFWGAELHDISDGGHLNPAAGFGSWSEARRRTPRISGAQLHDIGEVADLNPAAGYGGWGEALPGNSRRAK